MGADSIFTSEFVARVVLAIAMAVVFVGLVVVVAKAAGRSSQHEVSPAGEAFHCSCGQIFETQDSALRHAERRRDEVRVTGTLHPHLGHPLR